MMLLMRRAFYPAFDHLAVHQAIINPEELNRH